MERCEKKTIVLREGSVTRTLELVDGKMISDIYAIKTLNGDLYNLSPKQAAGIAIDINTLGAEKDIK